jgi:glycosyltransferase involved in cell wall biosynthesis
MTALVSVVIPTYNHARFLRKALHSVIAQTYSHWEAIVVDNHSEDDTVDVVQGLADPRISLMQIHNQGVIASSRNLAVRHARGEWIAFLDSDDSWYPSKLEATIRAATALGGCDVAGHDELTVDIRTGGRSVLRHGPARPDFYKYLLVEGNRLSPSATMVRRQFIERHGIRFDESTEFVTVEDYGFWLDLARHGARFRFLPEVLAEFVVHGDNTSQRLERHTQNLEALLRRHVFEVQDFARPSDLWKRVATRLAVGEARSLLARRRYVGCLNIVLRTLATSPLATASCVFSKMKLRARI